MFYTNKQVAEQINEIYNSDSNRSSNNNALKLPEKYEMLDKLNSRQPIMLYYLKNSVTPAKEQDEIPEINVTLLSFFMYPFGSRLWSDDKSLKILSTDNFIVPQDMCDELINVRYKGDSFDDFVDRLNKNT